MPDMRRLLLHRMPALNNIARLPWIKGNIRKLEKGGSLWEPSRLFDNGEKGAWYDPSDLSTMFQDSAGTTPVTAAGQPVGKILDKSGRGNHASQATATSRPLYKTNGTYHWLQFDGVDDSLSTAAINFTGTDSMSVFAGYIMTGGGTYRTLVELSADSAANNGSFGILGNNNAPTGNYLYCKGTNFATGQSMFPSNKNVFTILLDLSKSTIATELTARRNSVPDSLTYSGAASAGNGPFGNYPIFMGAKGGVSSIFGGNAYSIIIRGALSTPQEITNTETWVNGKTGAF